MGNKFDMLNRLFSIFPKENEVEIFYDVFGGSGVVSVNSPYKKNVYNELNSNIYGILNMLKNTDSQKVVSHIRERERV